MINISRGPCGRLLPDLLGTVRLEYGADLNIDIICFGGLADMVIVQFLN